MKIRPILIFSHIFFENSLQFQKLYLPLQPQTRKIGAIAQLVEQRTENPCVPGSIPGGTTDQRNNLRSDLVKLYICLKQIIINYGN